MQIFVRLVIFNIRKMSQQEYLSLKTLDTIEVSTPIPIKKKPMKLIAEFALQKPPSKQVPKNILKATARHLKQRISNKEAIYKSDSDPEVINLKVPVENLNKNMLIQIECRNTNINIELHPPETKDHFVEHNRNIRAFQALSTEKNAEKLDAISSNRMSDRGASKLSVFKNVFSKRSKKSGSANSFKWLWSEERDNPMYESESETCYSSGFLTRSTLFPTGSIVSLGSESSKLGGDENRLTMYNTL